MKKLSIIGLLSLFLTSCTLEELMSKTNKMTEVIQANCDCDDVRLLSYEDNMGGESTAYFEVVGAEVVRHALIASEINKALKQNINNYCDIDELTLDFINKGKHSRILISNCEIKK
ncbi:hypothetical protein [Hymenobacter ruricola]|uniref:Lipoprotein n=1 Tax=Hymenobacter ruricola TaxID=2791023 RepID=A0ABS0I5X9_9BACT|nr:hypothetical protein [Hymenobacter ruricola]MBF9222370.1 hypothetical protein [Hymenobacter ruricola]